MRLEEHSGDTPPDARRIACSDNKPHGDKHTDHSNDLQPCLGGGITRREQASEGSTEREQSHELEHDCDEVRREMINGKAIPRIIVMKTTGSMMLWYEEYSAKTDSGVAVSSFSRTS